MEARAAGNGLSKISRSGNEFHQVQGNILITARAGDSCKGVHESSKRRVQPSIVTSSNISRERDKPIVTSRHSPRISRMKSRERTTNKSNNWNQFAFFACIRGERF